MNKQIILTAAMAVALSACSTVKHNAKLDDAKNRVAAVNSSEVQKNAPVLTYEAQQLVDQAQAKWDEDGEKSMEQVSHLLYKANRKLDIAQSISERKNLEAESNKLAKQREKLILQARMQEIESAKQQIAQLKNKLTEKEQLLKDFQTKETDRGLIITLEDVLFDFDKASLRPESTSKLAPLVEYLRTESEPKLVVEGHTDSVGDEAYNAKLSQERADAVKRMLVINGIDPSRLVTRGLGEEYPVADNSVAYGRAKNRRVEIVVEK